MGSPTWARTSSVSVSSGAPGTRRLYQAKRRIPIATKKGKEPQEAQEAQESDTFLCLLCFLWFLPLLVYKGVDSEGSGKRILTANVIAVVLCRIAIDQRAAEQRVLQAADLVFDGEENLVGGGIDDVTKTPFVAVGLTRDAFQIHQASIWSREIGDVDLDVMPIVRSQLLPGLAKEDVLIPTCPNRCRQRSITHTGRRLGAKNPVIKRGDACRRAHGDGKLYISEPKFNRTEVRRWRM